MPFRKLTLKELKADSESPDSHFACFKKTFANALQLPEQQLIIQYAHYRDQGLGAYIQTKKWSNSKFEDLCDKDAFLVLEAIWRKKDNYEEPCSLSEMRCPKTHQRHKFDEGRIVGYSWHGN